MMELSWIDFDLIDLWGSEMLGEFIKLSGKSPDGVPFEITGFVDDTEASELEEDPVWLVWLNHIRDDGSTEHIEVDLYMFDGFDDKKVQTIPGFTISMAEMDSQMRRVVN